MNIEDKEQYKNRIGLSWQKVTSETYASLQENKLTEAVVGEKVIGLLKREGNVFAFAAKCPHAGAPMCDGWMDAAGRIVCPLHKYRFDPKNGRNTSGEGYKLYTYPVEIKDDEIWVGLVLS